MRDHSISNFVSMTPLDVFKESSGQFLAVSVVARIRFSQEVCTFPDVFVATKQVLEVKPDVF